MEITPRQWLVALLIAGLVHAALAYALVQSSAPLSRATSGVTLELGDGRGSSGGDGADSSSDALRPEPAGRAPSIAPTPSPLQHESDADFADAGEPIARSLPAPSEALVAKAVVQPHPVPKQAVTQPREELPLAAPKPAQPSDQRSARIDAKQSAPRAAPRPEPTRSNSEPASSSQEPARARVSSQNAAGRDGGTGTGADARPGKNGTGAGDRSGRGKRSTGTADSGGGVDARNYYGRLATWLARHKRYPLQARRLGQEGTVKVTFTVSRSGRVLATRITQSSGYSLLDREAQAMLDRASPLPRIPASLGRDSLTISLPVAFALR